MLLRWALHFGSGNSLFSGLLLIVLVCGAVTLRKGMKCRGAFRIALLLGVLLVVLSATPFPLWVYIIWMGTLVVWLYVIRNRGAPHANGRRMSTVAGGVLAASSFILGLCEATTLFPRMPRDQFSVLYVIGDSVTAGLSDGELLWPSILADSQQVEVVNLAQPGAMVDSALKQAAQIPADAGGIILLEIGGNDLLSGRSSDEFRRNLTELIEFVSTPPGRLIVMMELPLPPFYNEYGRIQRELAAQHDILLISKREFARVLRAADGAVDGIHLSEHGQQMMADVVWNSIGALLKP